ncbi:SIR2 family NAD-dependent protein deacylase [Actinoplanes couchii]|uniref:NAD-dependent protein deacylase n=1 Tax=Actinoplanes couchii TaxID=403638 RepID=A0ABQ3X063_9ACTN|nr:NAD-dependent deacylase [Actinoplanes couchii]MDR6316222.1 NAD-dependent deacetylase [Actinoplanes couchii]GID51836.1 NAD-dependent protein deacylase 1 [Actinoplanes couchii]
MDDLHTAAGALAAARRVVVFTGAGISAESGVPTFRDALTGLWERFDAQSLATPQAFQDDPDLVWGWYEWRRSLIQRVSPNPGHAAVTTIQNRAPRTTVITQNVDDLHERAGSTDPIHLHGSLFAPRCASCARPAEIPEAIEPDEGRRLPPPRCRACAAPIRPGVVWFGEPLPEEALETAVQEATDCDLLLTIGTSGLVYPAAEIPKVATMFGATVIQINPQPTPLDPTATVNLHGPAAEILPALVEAAWPQSS